MDEHDRCAPTRIRRVGLSGLALRHRCHQRPPQCSLPARSGRGVVQTGEASIIDTRWQADLLQWDVMASC